ncbi:hypothetical protein SJ259_28205, partial [Klebsiella pneumoniae]|uniref:hypothetical protein n=1 Tax=Klebsiella pneumoniae TaxID=573 RepID=UPI0029DC55C8
KRPGSHVLSAGNARRVYVAFNVAPPLFIRRLSELVDNVGEQIDNAYFNTLLRLSCEPGGLYLP